MPKISRHRSIVSHYGARYETTLRELLSLREGTFAELVERSRSVVGDKLAGPLKDFLRCRNAFAHEKGMETLRDASAFVRLVNRIEYQLASALPSFHPELLTETDLVDPQPEQQVQHSVQSTTQETPTLAPTQHPVTGSVESPKARFSRPFMWGISAIVFALLFALFNGFTKTRDESYDTGGVLGFFPDHHHDVREEPNILFWLVVVAAIWMLLVWMWQQFRKPSRGRRSAAHRPE